MDARSRSPSFVWLRHEHLFNTTDLTMNIGKVECQNVIAALLRSGDVLILENLYAHCRASPKMTTTLWKPCFRGCLHCAGAKSPSSSSIMPVATARCAEPSFPPAHPTARNGKRIGGSYVLVSISFPESAPCFHFRPFVSGSFPFPFLRGWKRGGANNWCDRETDAATSIKNVNLNVAFDFVDTTRSAVTSCFAAAGVGSLLVRLGVINL